MLPLGPHCHSLLPCLSPPPLPLKRAGEQNWRHKKPRSQVEISTIYGNRDEIRKQILTSAVLSEDIRNKLFKWNPAQPNNRQLQTSATGAPTGKRALLSGRESLSPASDVRFIWINFGSWPCSVPMTAKLTLSWLGTRTPLHHVWSSSCLPTFQSERWHDA